MHYVNALSLYSSFATYVIIYIENLFFGQQEEEICEKMKLIYEIFVTKLNYMTDYKVKRTKYLRTVGIFAVAFFLSSATAFSTLPELFHDIFFMTPVMLIGTFVLRVRWCQIALYLNMISDALKDLQIALTTQQMQSFEEFNEKGDNRFVPNKIRYIRKIYTHVWFIVTLMSDSFGWSMIIFLIEVRCELT